MFQHLFPVDLHATNGPALLPTAILVPLKNRSLRWLIGRTGIKSGITLLAVLSPAIGLALELPPTLKAGEQSLVLNGAGTREKYFLNLYVAGLYLSQPNNQPATIINADAPMAIHIVVTSKLVSQEKFIDSLQKGFQKSTRGKIEPIQVEIRQFKKFFTDKFIPGDIFDLVYLPNQGVMVFKNGKQKGNIPGLAFKRALFGIWLSDRPADANLKQALLGGQSKIRR